MGSAAFRLAEQQAYHPGDCLLEVGSEHGGGSTAVLATVARASGVPFYSIDIDPDITARLSSIQGVIPVCGRAEDVLAAWPYPEHVRFAWLDGYDWPYSFYPGPPWQVAAYAARNQKITQKDSQLSHLEIAQRIPALTGPGSVVAFDDTWPTPDGSWSGKGGTAVPFLLAGRWELESHSEVTPEPPGGDGYVVLRRL